MAFIYLITNKTNGKPYVGQTVHTLATRWWYHCAFARRQASKMAIHDAIRKYGPESFTIEVVEVVDPDKLDEREEFHIRRLHSHASEGGYNFNYGGNVIKYWLGKRHSQESLAKMSAIKKGIPLSAERIAQIRKSPFPDIIKTKRTHCRQGHSLDPAKNYVRADGYIVCRQCATLTQERFKQNHQGRRLYKAVGNG